MREAGWFVLRGVGWMVGCGFAWLLLTVFMQD
jgi:hypothetical protein